MQKECFRLLAQQAEDTFFTGKKLFFKNNISALLVNFCLQHHWQISFSVICL